MNQYTAQQQKYKAYKKIQKRCTLFRLLTVTLNHKLHFHVILSFQNHARFPKTSVSEYFKAMEMPLNFHYYSIEQAHTCN